MKAEHRKELETNALANWMGRVVQSGKGSSKNTYILTAIIVVLLIGVGVGWSEEEFRALGHEFHNRGARTDEIIDVLRTCWTDDPVSFDGEHYELVDLRLLPKPAQEAAQP